MQNTEATCAPAPAAEHFAQLVAIVARLRAPGGCPWDAQQTHASIARNMIEEAYEAVDAIEQADALSLREELGDVLLQVVFQSQIACENGTFTLTDVLRDINDKLVRRHPHVFGQAAALAAANRSLGVNLVDETAPTAPASLPGKPETRAVATTGELQLAEELVGEQLAASNQFDGLSEEIAAATDAQAVLDLWDRIKLLEKQRKADRRAGLNLPAPGLLDSVPVSLPALMQAQDISRKAVSVGFEWETEQAIWEQVRSEIDEFLAEPLGSAAAAQEFGDVLFSLVNVARANGIDAESALRLACDKFRRRWSIMEACASSDGRQLESYQREQLEALWQAAKTGE
jgi:uncharacterized protein YabN with tetrapyrrole methylase and pyrophosphatase domain